MLRVLKSLFLTAPAASPFLLNDVSHQKYEEAAPTVFPVAVFHQFSAPKSLPLKKNGQHDWSWTIQKNLDLMDRAMELAMRNTSTEEDALPARAPRPPRLIVFPEDGVFTLDALHDISRRTNAAQGLCVSTSDFFLGRRLGDEVPLGEEAGWETTGQFALRSLGKLAAKHGIFLVATLYECDEDTSSSFEPQSPKKRRRPASPRASSVLRGSFERVLRLRKNAVYNTALAVDDRGVLVAKYRKRHLYGGTEWALVTPGGVTPDEDDLADAVFDLPVEQTSTIVNPKQNIKTTVRVGLVICADLMWRRPLRTLQSVHGVTHFVAPALWYDGTTPTLAQFQAVSGMLKAVLIVANLHYGSNPPGESGIFDNFKALVHGRLPQRVLVADVPVRPACCTAPRLSITRPLFLQTYNPLSGTQKNHSTMPEWGLVKTRRTGSAPPPGASASSSRTVVLSNDAVSVWSRSPSWMVGERRRYWLDTAPESAVELAANMRFFSEGVELPEMPVVGNGVDDWTGFRADNLLKVEFSIQRGLNDKWFAEDSRSHLCGLPRKDVRASSFHCRFELFFLSKKKDAASFSSRVAREFEISVQAAFVDDVYVRECILQPLTIGPKTRLEPAPLHVRVSSWYAVTRSYSVATTLHLPAPENLNDEVLPLLEPHTDAPAFGIEEFRITETVVPTNDTPVDSIASVAAVLDVRNTEGKLLKLIFRRLPRHVVGEHGEDEYVAW